ncbi:MAG: hypothetical protein ACRD8Z_22890, partial [Nitrososphaeraceae archaeon]
FDRYTQPIDSINPSFIYLHRKEFYLRYGVKYMRPHHIGLVLVLTVAIFTAGFIVHQASAQVSKVPQCQSNTTRNATDLAVPPGDITIGGPSIQMCETSCCAACTRCVNTGDCTTCYANCTAAQ